jgi:hypothetical protein
MKLPEYVTTEEVTLIWCQILICELRHVILLVSRYLARRYIENDKAMAH